MATLKLENIQQQRSFADIITKMTLFVDGLAALDTIESAQIIKVSEEPSAYWGCIIIWSDDA